MDQFPYEPRHHSLLQSFLASLFLSMGFLHGIRHLGQGPKDKTGSRNFASLRKKNQTGNDP